MVCALDRNSVLRIQASRDSNASLLPERAVLLLLDKYYVTRYGLSSVEAGFCGAKGKVLSFGPVG